MVAECGVESRVFFFFNDRAPTEIYTLSLHDALPIWWRRHWEKTGLMRVLTAELLPESELIKQRYNDRFRDDPRSEEHTSELQSRQYLVCRLLLEKKNNTITCSRPHPTIHHRTASTTR